MKSRVTLRQVAAEAGVHHVTASRALKNDPRVHPQTLAKIQEISRRLGYMPDPMLSALNAYRHAKRPSHYHGTIAWITNYPTRDGWRQSSCYQLYHQGAEEQLAKHGYNVEEFWLREPRMTARRASQILLHRGIRGLLICPLPANRGHLSLRWESFSAISFGYSLLRPKLHLFSAAHYNAVITAMRTLRAMGHRRIGLVTSQQMNERMNRIWTAAFQAEAPAGADAPVHLFSHPLHAPSPTASAEIKAAFLKWYRQHKPDAILAAADPVAYWLADAGYRVPDDVVVVNATLQEGEPFQGGIVESSREIGCAAANFLAGMLQRGEYGAPRVPQRVLLEGTWFDGKTTRPPRLKGAALPALPA